MSARHPLPPHAATRFWALALAVSLAASACVPSSDATTTRSPSRAGLDTASPLPGLTPEAGSVHISVDGVGGSDAPGAGTAVARPVPGGDRAVAPLSAGPRDVLLVGDSVLVLVADDLARRINATLHVDGADCRRLDRAVIGPCGGVPSGVQVSDGVTAVRNAVRVLADEGVVPDAAVFVLANNSSITEADLADVMDATATIPHVWWVTTRIDGFGRQDPNNRMLASLADSDPRAGIVDWFEASAGRDWLSDNVHPNEVGQTALARLISDRLDCGCTS